MKPLAFAAAAALTRSGQSGAWTWTALAAVVALTGAPSTHAGPGVR